MTQSKYDPNKNGNAQNKPHHYKQNFDEQGNYLLYGNGCAIGGESCFTCKLPDCMWDNNNLTRKKMIGGERELSMG